MKRRDSDIITPKSDRKAAAIERNTGSTYIADTTEPSPDRLILPKTGDLVSRSLNREGVQRELWEQRFERLRESLLKQGEGVILLEAVAALKGGASGERNIARIAEEIGIEVILSVCPKDLEYFTVQKLCYLLEAAQVLSKQRSKE